jgi:hypothetical protein
VLRELSLEHRAELASAGSALAAALRAILARQRKASHSKTARQTCTTKLGDFTSTPRMITISSGSRIEPKVAPGPASVSGGG